MKKFVLRLDLSDSNDKRKALKTISALPGIDEIAMDMNSKQLTVIGKVDPVTVVSKLRKHWTADIISVGPAKEPEPEKKEEPKKEEPKKEEEKKEEQPKEESKKDEAKKEEGKKEEEKKPMVGITMPYRQYYYHYPPMNTHYNYAHHHHSIEENPNACVIC